MCKRWVDGISIQRIERVAVVVDADTDVLGSNGRQGSTSPARAVDEVCVILKDLMKAFGTLVAGGTAASSSVRANNANAIGSHGRHSSTSPARAVDEVCTTPQIIL